MNNTSPLQLFFGVNNIVETKKELIYSYIENNIKMTTKDIISNFIKLNGIEISERHIQRIRKEIIKKRHNTFGKGEKERSVNGGNDKYYTKNYIADYYSHIVYEKYGNNYQYIEPTAGNGSFLNIIPNIIGYDLKPENDNILKMNIFNNTFNENNIIIGNPPFGISGSLAIKIFNYIASFSVKAICFILPKSFKKNSVKNKLNISYKLIFEQDIIPNAFIVNKKEHNVPCVFQIWEKSNIDRKIIEDEKFIWIEFTNKENADIAVRRAGSKAGQILNGLEYNEVSTYFLKIKSPMVIKAIKLIDLSIIDYTAGVRSISKNELNSEINRIMKILN